jgi:hypothetical protein
MIEKIIFFVILALALIVFILAIVALINLRGKSAFSTSPDLQTSYDFTIGILVINLFVLMFTIVALVYYIKAKFLRTQALTLLTFLIMFSVLGSIILGGYSAVRSRETVTIVNLVMSILQFILIVVFLFLFRKVPFTTVNLGICGAVPVVVQTKSE